MTTMYRALVVCVVLLALGAGCSTQGESDADRLVRDGSLTSVGRQGLELPDGSVVYLEFGGSLVSVDGQEIAECSFRLDVNELRIEPAAGKHATMWVEFQPVGCWHE